VAPEALYGALLNGNYWVPESLLVRRTCYQAMWEFDTSPRACEDWHLRLRFSLPCCRRADSILTFSATDSSGPFLLALWRVRDKWHCSSVWPATSSVNEET
jgi:hypothetical protein